MVRHTLKILQQMLQNAGSEHGTSELIVHIHCPCLLIVYISVDNTISLSCHDQVGLMRLPRRLIFAWIYVTWSHFCECIFCHILRGLLFVIIIIISIKSWCTSAFVFLEKKKYILILCV